MKKNLLTLCFATSALALSGAAAIISSSVVESFGASVGSDVLATFVDYNGKEIYETRVAYGASAVFPQNLVPSREDEGAVSYHFAGWDKPLADLRQDTLFTAVYEATYDTCTATFLNIDGVYLWSVNVPYGEKAYYGGPTPTYESIEGVTYTWDGGWGREFEPLTGDVTYVATYDRVDSRHIVEFHNQNDEVISTVMVADGMDIAPFLIPTVYVETYSQTGERRSVPSPRWSMTSGPVTQNLVLRPVVPTYDESFFSVQYDAQRGGYILGGIDSNYPASWPYINGVSLSIPSLYCGETIVGLGSYSVTSTPGVTHVSLPSTITRIEESAFRGNTSIQSVELNTSVDYIGSYAFEGCAHLSSVTHESPIQTIGSGAFQHTALTTFDLGNKITSLAEDAFNLTPMYDARWSVFGATYLPLRPNRQLMIGIQNLDMALSNILDGTLAIFFNQPSNVRPLTCSLSNIAFPAGLRIIGGGSSLFETFGGSLESLTLPASFSFLRSDWASISIDRLVFEGSLNEFFNVEFQSVSWEIRHLYCGGSEVVDLIVPEGVTEIRSNLFRGNRGITSVSFPSTLKRVGESAFASTAISSAYLPDEVEEVGYRAFANCSYLTSARIPACVLGEGAFAECGSLSNLTLEEGLEAIPSNAFASDYKLRYVFFPSTLRSIGAEAFLATQLNYDNPLNFPSSLRFIGRRAFAGVSIAYQISVPSSVDTIDYAAFPVGASINFWGGIEQVTRGHINLGYDVYEYEDLRYYVYLNGNSASYLTLPSSVTALRDGIFANWTNVQSVTFAGKVASIGKRAFYNCRNLNSVTAPESLVNFSADAFQGCVNLHSFDITNNPNFEVAADGAVYDATGRTLLFVPNSVSGTYSIREGTITVGDGAFALAANITQIICPSSLRIIGQEALSRPNLTSVVLNEGLEFLGDRAFSGENAYGEIAELTLPSTLKYCSNAFLNIRIRKLILAEGFGKTSSYMGELSSNTIDELHYPGSFEELLDAAFHRDYRYTRSFFDLAAKIYCRDGEGVEYLVTTEEFQTVDHLNDCACYNPEFATSLTSFVSSTLDSVGRYGFLGMRFETLKLSGLSYAAPYAFKGLDNLRMVDLRGSSLAEIQYNAFEDCGMLTNIYLNEGLRKIGSNAFNSYHPGETKTVLVPSTLEYVADYAFGVPMYEDDAQQKVRVLLPEGGLANYEEIFAGAGRYNQIEFVPYGEGSASTYWTLDENNVPVIAEA